MPRFTPMIRSRRLGLIAAVWLAGAAMPAITRAQQAQPVDAEYTAQIRRLLSDPRISTELVNYLPASATVPSPLKFFGHVVGTPNTLHHAADIHRYYEALAKAAPRRARYWSIGKTEEGRDMVVLAIADEATMARLDAYKGYLAELTDPRRTSEARAQQLIQTAKPIYWITSGMHSSESGGPETLIEFAYRLVVDDAPFFRNIRSNVITFITPVIEVDGRERFVDTWLFNRQWNREHNPDAPPSGRGSGGPLPLMYWGKYVAHDNNRDGMGQFLALTRNVTRTFLDWKPTVLHDLHEAQTYLYSSTGTGPYSPALDPIVVDEWWYLAKYDVMEMTKRGVPGVWTYGFYDGWVPNYMFFIAHSHNAIGRFYEVQSFCCDNYVVRPGATTTSKEWFRPNPPLDSITWSPRANVNIQSSALFFSLSRMAQDRQLFLDNYWRKNKRAVDKGKATAGTVAAWVLPAGQHARQNVAEAVNDLKTQGLEFHTATSAFSAGGIQVNAGDYIIRGDQPYRTLADMYFSLQSYAPSNPSPYDDTGWTFPLMRNITLLEITDKSILSQPMTRVPQSTVVTAPGGITGAGSVVIVERTSDNSLISFRFKLPTVRMAAAEQGFVAGGRSFPAGSIIIPSADRGRLDAALRQFGLRAYAVAETPAVKQHDLDIPRVGYIHSWRNTQDEGWVRAALDTYGVPYQYFGENVVAGMGDLRNRFDVIIYPHGGTGVGTAAGGRGGNNTNTNNLPVPYRKSAAYPSLGYPDSTDDVRGGLGEDGMKALYAFVQHGGTLITEGNTAQLLPQMNLTPGVKVEPTNGLFARGSIMRGIISDSASPLVYGYRRAQVPIYFNTGPILNAGSGGVPLPEVAAGRGVARQNTTPMSTPMRLSPWDPDRTGTTYGLATSLGTDFNFDRALPSATPAGNAAAGGGRGGGRGGGGGGRGGAGPVAVPGLTADPNSSTRVVVQFPADADDMLLSGTLERGEVLSSRATLVDERIGRGHAILFAFRPFWRWQTQGTFAMGFNAIMHWNDLDAGK